MDPSRLRAPDMQSLESGAVKCPLENRSFGLDLGLIEAQVQEGKTRMLADWRTSATGSSKPTLLSFGPLGSSGV